MHSTPPESGHDQTSPLRIGDFTVHPNSNEITRDTETIRVRPLIMQLLLRLALAPGTVISREQLIDDVWSRKVVNDEVLSRAIAELRIALGDDSKVPRYIETLPKMGYRLVASVNKLEPREPIPAAPLTVPPTTAVPSSVSVTSPFSTAETVPSMVAPSSAASHRSSRLFLAAMFALVVCGVGILVYTATRDSNQIAVPTEQALIRQISAATTFASDPDAELAPRFAADGQKIIYVRRNAQRSEIVIHDLPSGNRSVAVAAPTILSSPVFFPDGKRIAYWRRTPGGCQIVEHALTTNTPRALLDCALDPQSRFDISPAGNHLVFVAQVRDYPSKLMLFDLASAEISVLTQPKPGEGNDMLPRFSPDGARIAFFRGSESHQRPWTVDVTAPHAAKPAGTVEGLSYGLSWMGPHGPILVAADWSGFRALNRLDLASGKTQPLGGRGARFPDVAPDGSIIFETATYRADLWLTDTAEPGTRKEVLWPSTRYSAQPEFSPDGKRVVFCSNREGSDGIYIGVVGGAVRRLPLPEGFRYIRPHWSPDGRHILVVSIPVSDSRPAKQAVQQQALRVDVESGRHEVLTNAGSAVNAIHVLANGDLLVGELADYTMRLIRVSSGGAAKTRLALPLVSEYAINGNTLVYTLPQLSGATRCELDTLRCTPIAIELNDENRFDWTLANDAIWFLGRNAEGKRALNRYDISSSQIVSHGFAPTGSGTSLSVSPDGKQIIVLQEEPTVIDLMLARKIADSN